MANNKKTLTQKLNDLAGALENVNEAGFLGSSARVKESSEIRNRSLKEIADELGIAQEPAVPSNPNGVIHYYDLMGKVLTHETVKADIEGQRAAKAASKMANHWMVVATNTVIAPVAVQVADWVGRSDSASYGRKQIDAFKKMRTLGA